MKEPASKSGKRLLTAVEIALLGLAYLRGPCSTYMLMKELSASASTYYKSRAGTAYSVTRRLVEFGYLRVLEPDGHVEITPSGLKALQDWIAPPIPPGDIAHSADLLRLRFFYLGALKQEDRLAFIEESLAGLRDLLVRCEGLIAENEALGDYYGALATVSVILETKARIRWMELVQKWVEEPMPEGVSWTETILAALEDSS